MALYFNTLNDSNHNGGAHGFISRAHAQGLQVFSNEFGYVALDGSENVELLEELTSEGYEEVDAREIAEVKEAIASPTPATGETASALVRRLILEASQK